MFFQDDPEAKSPMTQTANDYKNDYNSSAYDKNATLGVSLKILSTHSEKF